MSGGWTGLAMKQRLLLAVMMGVPFVVALFLLILALATGKALLLGFGWVALQLIGYWFYVPRLTLYPLHPMLAVQIAIHWLGTAFVLFFLMGGGA